jgi:pyruvate/2-oxoglutarate dehydrogenase complex dihydrolipoamide acyltransferase (E2) component
MPDRYQKLDFADLWMRDGLRVCRPPGGWVSVEVDMTKSLEIVGDVATRKVNLNWHHVIFRATALALARHPELHKLGAGSRVMYPQNVDLGISLAGESFVSPVMVLRGAELKELPVLAKEMISLIRKAKVDDHKMRAILRRWGWLIPFSSLRRLILAFLFKQTWFKRGGVGTFQISCISDLDAVCPFMFNTAAILGIGGVRERAVVVNGSIEIRPVVILTCCGDHELWDGRIAATFLGKLRNILESGELASEISKIAAHA